MKNERPHAADMCHPTLNLLAYRATQDTLIRYGQRSDATESSTGLTLFSVLLFG